MRTLDCSYVADGSLPLNLIERRSKISWKRSEIERDFNEFSRFQFAENSEEILSLVEFWLALAFSGLTRT